MTSLAPTASATPATVEDVKVGRLGLTIPGELDYDEWCRLGTKLGRMADAAAWAIADWAAYYETRWGSRYEHVMDATGLSYQAARDLAYVARHVQLSRRRDKLSISHHREVAALDASAQDYWLGRAEAENLSVMALRDLIRGRDEPKELGPPLVALKLAVPKSRRARWERAAKAAGVGLDEWAATVLDEAAA